MIDVKLMKRFEGWKTPFYFYDLELLGETLSRLSLTTGRYGFHVHYALKANVDRRILQAISGSGFGADCVSGNEIIRARESGFADRQIVFAGVGKSDEEIAIGLEHNIHSFNCESVQELQTIDQLARSAGKKARVALRINPDLDPKTHHYITTGREENKFGIHQSKIGEVMAVLDGLNNVDLTGIHFHIGSQVGDMAVFARLSEKANELNRWFDGQGIRLKHLNLGGGLGIDYTAPELNPIADFASYFSIFGKHLKPFDGQEVHFELGRSIVAQCGTLMSRVLYEKPGIKKTFLIIDAGMTELIRPALYQARHHITNISKTGDLRKYDVVGPICESSDCFARDVDLPETKRGDFIAIHSCGAYGEVMSSRYNLRPPAAVYYSDEVNG